MAEAKADPRTTVNERLASYYVQYYRDTLGLPGWERRVADRLHEDEFGARQLAGIEAAVGRMTGRSVLNVGCGTGGFNIAAERRGARTWGVDTNLEAVGICRLRAEQGAGGRYAAAAAEALPFPETAFDLVICLSTLEHVSDVPASLREMVRVLRPGGTLFIYAPSGWALYESHYKLPWLPWFPRRLARLYLKLRGRPTRFVETLNSLSVRRCRRLLAEAGAHVRDLPPVAGEEAMGVLPRAYYRLLGVRPYIALVARRPA